MSITTLEQASIALGRAATLVDLHDSIVGRLLKARSDFELGMVKKPEDFNASAILFKLKEVEEDVREFERRILLLADVDSFQDYRRAVLRGQHQLEVLRQYQERIDQQEFLMASYQDSDTEPVDLDEGDGYDLDAENAKLDSLEAQYASAVGLFIGAVGSFDIGDPSTLEFPQLIASV